MLYSLPTEIKLYIFKLLNYKELCSIKQTNIYFHNFINNFEGELAREKFCDITIDCFNQFNEYPYKLIKPKDVNFDFPFNEQLEEKLKNGLRKPIPLYLPLYSNKNTVICLTKVCGNKQCYHPELPTIIRNIADIEECLLLQLPTNIKSKEDVKIVYYYLNKLFNCSFGRGNFDRFIFNPELIQLLFGGIHKQFYVQKSWLFMYYNFENKFQFILNHLNVSESIRINIALKDDANYTDILFKILTSGGDKFNEVYLVAYNLQKVFDLIINHIETSKDCSKMVANIVLNNRNINFASLNERAEKIEDCFQLSNIYNPKIKFSILFTRQLKKSTIKRF
uniref:F-box domain-containing protein n=1 Tax=Meloidogyne enterolobii TaxID=390850 RepID=A0A6V7WW59_MELEN|nr:unnamed protein product [Meloidogyne enterolobii]